MSHSRRDWLKHTAALLGGAAAVGATGSVIDAEGQTSAPGTPAVTAAPAARIILAPNARNIVETTAGKVRGYVRNGIFTFKGIPYVASTASKNRFMPPAEPAKWTGARDALAYGSSAPQREPGVQPRASTLAVAAAGLPVAVARAALIRSAIQASGSSTRVFCRCFWDSSRAPPARRKKLPSELISGDSGSSAIARRTGSRPSLKRPEGSARGRGRA